VERGRGGVFVESDGLERAEDTHRHERVEADNRISNEERG
jgi:hypothetical protein